MSAPTSAPEGTLAKLGRALGPKYEVRRVVGSGGFAEVYEVWDKCLERRLAVKVLRPDVAWTSGMIERFQRETRAAARLEHPNILPIHFVGDGEGLVYYAMPFVDGMSLGELLKRSGALPPERALAIIIPILDALDHAHKAGLIHRDIKPDNIMLDTARGRPLLVDFGIARRLDSEAGAGLTQTGLVIGTPHYMSPEQALGDPNLGPRSDLYSLGCVLFQMVTGSPPFDGESSQQVVGKHIADPPPAASDVNPKVPRELSDVILRCLQKQPSDRFQSAGELIAALESDKQPSTMRSRASAAQAATELLVSGARTAPNARRHVGTTEAYRLGHSRDRNSRPGTRCRCALFPAADARIRESSDRYCRGAGRWRGAAHSTRWLVHLEARSRAPARSVLAARLAARRIARRHHRDRAAARHGAGAGERASDARRLLRAAHYQ